MCFTVQLSKIGFALPFVSNSFAIISCRFLPVKNFFQLFSKSFYVFDLSAATFTSYHNSLYIVKNFFHFFDSIVFVSCNSDIIAFISVFVNCLFTFFYIFPYLIPLTPDCSLLYAFVILRFNWIMAVGIKASTATWIIAVTGIVCIWNSPCNPGIKITSPRNAAPAANA